MTDEAGFGGVAEQCLDHRQGDQFGVGEFRGDPNGRVARAPSGGDRSTVVDRDVESGRERVQVSVHACVLQDQGV